MEQLVSIIVPVYNVERYLSCCIDSILNQTYRCFELVLIDDGSRDSSGDICDDYAKKDERIRVIHQVNKGLAAVRNLGISEARGDYIQFIDSDDWVSPELVENSLSYMKKYDADIVCFRVVSVFSNSLRRTKKVDYEKKVLSNKEALSVIFYPQYVDVVTCNKFFKKSVLDDITYPNGKLYEDMYTTYKIIAKAQRILCISDEYYYYRKNTNSIGFRSVSEESYEVKKAVGDCYTFCTNFE
jgi:glycosyltransferase involved in cell wall biosynthesis